MSHKCITLSHGVSARSKAFKELGTYLISSHHLR